MKTNNKYRILNRMLRIQPLLFILIVTCNACDCHKDGCQLTSEDKEWLLDKYDKVSYLKNGVDTVEAIVTTGSGQSEYDWQFGIRSGDNNYYEYSSVTVNIHDNDTIIFRFSVHGCENEISIISASKINGKFLKSNNYLALKDSIPNYDYMIGNITYENCYYFFNECDTVINEFIFAKKHGILMFKIRQNEIFEKLPIK